LLKWLSSSDLESLPGPEGSFLRAETNTPSGKKGEGEDGKESEGGEARGWLREGEEGKWVLYGMTRNEAKGWVSEQVTGFEIVQGKRMLVRRSVVRNEGGEMAMGRMVIDYVGEK
jgi:hypothetical protein